MATHSSILAWGISWTEDPGRLQSMGLQRVGKILSYTFSFEALNIIDYSQSLPSLDFL